MLSGLNINTGGNMQLTGDLINMKQPIAYLHDITDNIIPLLKIITDILKISYIQYAIRFAIVLRFVFKLLDRN